MTGPVSGIKSLKSLNALAIYPKAHQLEVRSQGEVRLVVTVGGVRHQHLLLAVSPGNTVTQHTSLLVDLTHHNTWTQHHLAINNNTLNTIVTLSVTGDILGPLILQHIKPAVRIK